MRRAVLVVAAAAALLLGGDTLPGRWWDSASGGLGTPVYGRTLWVQQPTPTVPWYLAGGAPAPLVAWQPIGAASQAASYAPVVGSLAASAVGAPGWSAAAGWELPDPMAGHVQLGGADSAFARGFAATASGTLCVRWRNRVEPSNDLRHIVGTSLVTVGRGWALAVDDRDAAQAENALTFVVNDGAGFGNYIANARTENNVVAGTAPHVACVQMAGIGVGVAVWVDGAQVAVDQQKIADRAGVSGVGAARAGRGINATHPFPGPVDVHALAWWPGDAQPSAAQIAAISAAMAAL
jgi:hypothetical protein